MRSWMRAARSASSSSASVASGRAKRRLARIVSWKRCGSCIDEADRRVQRVEREVAHVVAVDAHRALARRRTMRGTSIAIVVLPAPDGPTSATVSPGSTVSDTSRRIHSLGSSPPGVPARLERRERHRRRRPGGGTTRGRTRPGPRGSTRSTAPGRSVIDGGEVEHLEDALERHERGQHVDARVRELRERLVDLADVEHERGDGADRDRADDREVAADEVDDRGADRGDEPSATNSTRLYIAVVMPMSRTPRGAAREVVAVDGRAGRTASRRSAPATLKRSAVVVVHRRVELHALAGDHAAAAARCRRAGMMNAGARAA